MKIKKALIDLTDDGKEIKIHLEGGNLELINLIHQAMSTNGKIEDIFMMAVDFHNWKKFQLKEGLNADQKGN